MRCRRDRRRLGTNINELGSSCGHCGHAITGEQVTKKTKAGENKHNYYRCSKYLTKGHPRIRLREAEIDAQILKLLDSIRIHDESLREWFGMVLRSKTRDDQERCRADKLGPKPTVTL